MNHTDQLPLAINPFGLDNPRDLGLSVANHSFASGFLVCWQLYDSH
jgi:hypothetical protein